MLQVKDRKPYSFGSYVHQVSYLGGLTQSIMVYPCPNRNPTFPGRVRSTGRGPVRKHTGELPGNLPEESSWDGCGAGRFCPDDGGPKLPCWRSVFVGFWAQPLYKDPHGSWKSWLWSYRDFPERFSLVMVVSWRPSVILGTFGCDFLGRRIHQVSSMIPHRHELKQWWPTTHV